MPASRLCEIHRDVKVKKCVFRTCNIVIFQVCLSFIYFFRYLFILPLYVKHIDSNNPVSVCTNYPYYRLVAMCWEFDFQLISSKNVQIKTNKILFLWFWCMEVLKQNRVVLYLAEVDCSRQADIKVYITWQIRGKKHASKWAKYGN